MTVSWITSETNDGGCTQAGFDDIFGHLYNSDDLTHWTSMQIGYNAMIKTILSNESQNNRQSKENNTSPFPLEISCKTQGSFHCCF